MARTGYAFGGEVDEQPIDPGPPIMDPGGGLPPAMPEETGYATAVGSGVAAPTVTSAPPPTMPSEEAPPPQESKSPKASKPKSGGKRGRKKGRRRVGFAGGGEVDEYNNYDSRDSYGGDYGGAADSYVDYAQPEREREQEFNDPVRDEIERSARSGQTEDQLGYNQEINPVKDVLDYTRKMYGLGDQQDQVGYGGQSQSPDLDGYMRGAHAMPHDQVDALRQRNPDLDENSHNLKTISDLAGAGDMQSASAMMANLRKRYDGYIAAAQGAAAHGDFGAAAQLAEQAHNQVPDGTSVQYTPTQDGVIASVNGNSFPMTAQQYHDYLVGPGTSFDHVLENGVAKNLQIATRGSARDNNPENAPPYQVAGGWQPPPTAGADTDFPVQSNIGFEDTTAADTTLVDPTGAAAAAMAGAGRDVGTAAEAAPTGYGANAAALAGAGADAATAPETRARAVGTAGIDTAAIPAPAPRTTSGPAWEDPRLNPATAPGIKTGFPGSEGADYNKGVNAAGQEILQGLKNWPQGVPEPTSAETRRMMATGLAQGLSRNQIANIAAAAATDAQNKGLTPNQVRMAGINAVGVSQDVNPRFTDFRTGIDAIRREATGGMRPIPAVDAFAPDSSDPLNGNPADSRAAAAAARRDAGDTRTAGGAEDGRRVDTQGRPIGPALGETVPRPQAAAASAQVARPQARDLSTPVLGARNSYTDASGEQRPLARQQGQPSNLDPWVTGMGRAAPASRDPNYGPPGQAPRRNGEIHYDESGRPSGFMYQYSPPSGGKGNSTGWNLVRDPNYPYPESYFNQPRDPEFSVRASEPFKQLQRENAPLPGGAVRVPSTDAGRMPGDKYDVRPAEDGVGTIMVPKGTSTEEVTRRMYTSDGRAIDVKMPSYHDPNKVMSILRPSMSDTGAAYTSVPVSSNPPNGVAPTQPGQPDAQGQTVPTLPQNPMVSGDASRRLNLEAGQGTPNLTQKPQGSAIPDQFMRQAQQQMPGVNDAQTGKVSQLAQKLWDAERGLATKDTPAAKQARVDAQIAGANFRTLSTLDQRNTYAQMKDTWESNKLAQRALEMVERSGNAGMADILKGYRARLFNDPEAKPTQEELGAMYHAHQLINRAPTTTPPPPASAVAPVAAPVAAPTAAPTAAAPAAGGQAPVRVTSPAQARSLPSGTQFQTPDGQIRIRP